MASFAHAGLSEEQVQALIQRVNELEQKVKILERNKEVKEEIDTEKSKTQPTVSIGVGGLQVRSGDSNFVMNVHGYAQADGRFYFGHKAPGTSDNFLLRRVRPIIEGTVWKDYNYRVMLDLPSGSYGSNSSNNVAILDDAYVNAHFWNEAQFQIGKYKLPVGLERLKSTAELGFIETGYATQLTPNYDVGAMVHNDVFTSRLGYAAGIFTGAADGASQDTGLGSGKDVVGRIFVQPFLNESNSVLQHLGFGVGGTYGTHTGNALPKFTSIGQQALFSYSTNLASAGPQYRIDPQAYYYYGPFGLNAEYILSAQKFANAAAGLPPNVRFKNAAWQLEGSYFLTGEENSFRYTSSQHLDPIRRFGVLDGTGWGALELLARIQQLKLDNKIFDADTLSGGTLKTPYGSSTSVTDEATSWGLGLNWYLNANIKLSLDYENTTFRQRFAVPGSVGYKPEHALFTQAQFSF